QSPDRTVHLVIVRVPARWPSGGRGKSSLPPDRGKGYVALTMACRAVEEDPRANLAAAFLWRSKNRVAVRAEQIRRGRFRGRHGSSSVTPGVFSTAVRANFDVGGSGSSHGARRLGRLPWTARPHHHDRPPHSLDGLGRVRPAR